MGAEGDVRAPGAAITVALCGHWEHEPPCPWAPHRTDAHRAGDEVRLRTVFAAEPAEAAEVREAIDRALATGHLRGPDGAITMWRVLASRAGDVTAEDRRDADRMAS